MTYKIGAVRFKYYKLSRFTKECVFQEWDGENWINKISKLEKLSFKEILFSIFNKKYID